MANKTYKLGELITIIDERNSYGIRDFYGININKEFMPTVADTNGLDESNYKIVRKNRFVFSGMQTGRDECIRISMYQNDNPIIVSPAYTTFEVTRTDIVLPTYFFLIFLSKEKDRLGWFYSDASIRSNLDWPVFCDIDITLPDLKTQEKYVEIYEALVENQKSYERGLDDLKLTCDAYLDKLKKEKTISLGDIIEKTDKRNNNLEYGEDDVRGIINLKEFAETKADLIGVDLSKFKIIEKNEFAYNSRTDGRDMLVMALNRDNKPIIVTFNYNSFVIKQNMLQNVDPEFLYAFFKRAEFDRLVRFNSWGSSQELLSWEYLCDIKVPYPSLEIQHSIADVYKVFNERKAINEKLKSQIKDICPILIKGALEES